MILICIPLPTGRSRSPLPGRSHLGHNISCYNCEGLERHCTKATLKANHHKYLKNCHGIGDRCMRIWQKTDYTELVHSLCADERLCDEMEKVCEEKKTAPRDPYDCIVSCCHDDACNSVDAGVNFNLYLVILCSAVGVTEALNFT